MVKDLLIFETSSFSNFVLGHFGRRAIEVRDALRDRVILVRDRSYEIPGGVRITVGACEQTERVLNVLDRIW
jgi:histidinol-phosphate aminotransferase